MSNDQNSDDLSEIFGETIYAYTRAQALADGTLVDATKLAKEAGWRYPVAVTAAVWKAINAIPSAHNCQDVAGRLWDVLSMSAQAAKRSDPGCSRFLFELILFREGVKEKYV